MKEIMVQYGQSVIAVLIAVLLLLVIGFGSNNKRIYERTGQVLGQQENVEVSGSNEEFERYWRLR